MNPCSHLVNGPCQCAVAVAARARAVPWQADARGFTAYGSKDADVRGAAQGGLIRGEGVWASPAYAEQLAAYGSATGQPNVATTHCGHGRPLSMSAPCEECFPVSAPVSSGAFGDGAHRLFTRQEVLTVPRAQRAVGGNDPGENAVLNRLFRIFERME